MSESTEWVKLPDPAPNTLPEGTMVRSSESGLEYVAPGCGYHRQSLGFSDGYWSRNDPMIRVARVGEVKLPPGYRFEGSEVVRDQECSRCEGRFPASELDENVFHGERVCRACAGVDDLGDTPEHLKPLLRAARERVPGTVVSQEIVGPWGKIALWDPQVGVTGYGHSDAGQGLASLFGRGGTGVYERRFLKAAIEQGRCYPTADARRIGREEFGLKFYSCGADSIARRQEATRQRLDAEFLSQVKELGMKPEALERLESAMGKPEPTRVLTSPIRIEKARACACGATSNLRDVVIERKESPGRPTLTVYETRCGACEVQRRRAELLANMDCKVTPKDPEKSLAPASWPEDAGDDYEL